VSPFIAVMTDEAWTGDHTDGKTYPVAQLYFWTPAREKAGIYRGLICLHAETAPKPLNEYGE
jgi:hypothetical protein